MTPTPGLISISPEDLRRILRDELERQDETRGEQLGILLARQEALEQQFARTSRFIEGNGKMGILDRLNQVEVLAGDTKDILDKREAQEAEERKRKETLVSEDVKFRRQLWVAIIPLTIATILSLISEIFLYYIHIIEP